MVRTDEDVLRQFLALSWEKMYEGVGTLVTPTQQRGCWRPTSHPSQSAFIHPLLVAPLAARRTATGTAHALRPAPPIREWKSGYA